MLLSTHPLNSFNNQLFLLLVWSKENDGVIVWLEKCQSFLILIAQHGLD